MIVLMSGCMRYLSLVIALPAVEDRQASPCEEKQNVASTAKQNIELLNETDGKT